MRELNSTNNDIRTNISGFWKFFDEAPEDFEGFFKTTLPFIQKMVLELPKHFAETGPSLLLLQTNEHGHLEITRLQALSLLAAGFFCLHALHKPVRGSGPRFRTLNFDGIWATINMKSQRAKFHCLVNYFNRQRERLVRRSALSGSLLFHRRVILMQPHMFQKSLAVDTRVLGDFVVCSEGGIEDQGATLQADFANKFLGGGVLQKGCIQEEIRFMLNPECLVGLLFVEVMNKNESLIIVGPERFNAFTGYSYDFRYDGDFVDDTPIDKKTGRRKTVIVAIDALRLYKPREQFSPSLMTREVFKAYNGFSVLDDFSPELEGKAPFGFNTISTGNWGCGAFGGDVGLKSMLQWIAATKAGLKVRYFSYGDVSTVLLPDVVKLLLDNRVTVCQLWEALQVYSKSIEAVDQLGSPEREEKKTEGDERTPYIPAHHSVFEHLLHAFQP